MKNKIVTCLLAIAVAHASYAQEDIEIDELVFSYDASGSIVQQTPENIEDELWEDLLEAKARIFPSSNDDELGILEGCEIETAGKNAKITMPEECENSKGIVRIYSSAGALKMSSFTNGLVTTIKLSSLKKGMYLVLVSVDNKKKVSKISVK